LRARGLFAAGGGDVDPTTWPHDEFVHAWWVEPGRLLAGEYAGDPDAAHARQKVDLLVDAGGRTFVELTTTADRLEPYDRLVREVADGRRLDLCPISLPIPTTASSRTIDTTRWRALSRQGLDEARCTSIVGAASVGPGR
jgi:hypothetical protein